MLAADCCYGKAMDRTASCACGQLTVLCVGEPDRVSLCHCTQCKRRTGSEFSWNATWPDAAVTPSGRFSSNVRHGDSGLEKSYFFCPDCGSTVFYRVGMRPGMTSVPAGGLADPDFPGPAIAVYAKRSAPWPDLDLPYAD